MRLASAEASLTEQAYEAIVEAICDGSLPANVRLVQEQLADRFGVSRQPIQQALLLLRSDGIVVDGGGRGLVVAPLDAATARHRYQIRAALDELAVRLAAARAAGSPEVAAEIRRRGGEIVAAGRAAIEAGSYREMIARDVEFHGFLYEVSGNPALGPTAQVHWRTVRRVMGEALRHSSQPPTVWAQHAAIVAAITAGDAETAARLAVDHVRSAADRLAGPGSAPAAM